MGVVRSEIKPGSASDSPLRYRKETLPADRAMASIGQPSMLRRSANKAQARIRSVRCQALASPQPALQRMCRRLDCRSLGCFISGIGALAFPGQRASARRPPRGSTTTNLHHLAPATLQMMAAETMVLMMIVMTMMLMMSMKIVMKKKKKEKNNRMMITAMIMVLRRDDIDATVVDDVIGHVKEVSVLPSSV